MQRIDAKARHVGWNWPEGKPAMVSVHSPEMADEPSTIAGSREEGGPSMSDAPIRWSEAIELGIPERVLNRALEFHRHY
jgi:hypothetical protein